MTETGGMPRPPHRCGARDVAEGGLDEGRIVVGFHEAGIEVGGEILPVPEVERGVELPELGFGLCHSSLQSPQFGYCPGGLLVVDRSSASHRRREIQCAG